MDSRLSESHLLDSNVVLVLQQGRNKPYSHSPKTSCTAADAHISFYKLLDGISRRPSAADSANKQLRGEHYLLLHGYLFPDQASKSHCMRVYTCNQHTVPTVTRARAMTQQTKASKQTKENKCKDQ